MSKPKSKKTPVVDFERTICNFAGQALKIEGEQVVTLKYVAVTSLLSTDDRSMPGTEKYSRYRLAKQIYDDGLVALEPSSIQKLKQAIAQSFVPMIVGAAWDMLDGKSEPAPTQAPPAQDDSLTEEHA